MCRIGISPALSQEQVAVIAGEINYIVGTDVPVWLRNDKIAKVTRQLGLRSLNATT